MKLFLMIAALLGGCAPEPPQQDAAVLEVPVLTAEARALISPVADSIAAEQARQAVLPAPVDDRERLERMGRLDQVGRQVWNTIDLSGLPDGERQRADAAIGRSISALDEAHQAQLLTMVPPEGWFLRSRYGEAASSAAFLIVQHGNLELWRRFVPVLEPLVVAGEVDGEQYGLMYDRLAINEGRAQRYGSQMTCRDGRLVVDYANLEDPQRADERRAAIGFERTLAEYEALFEKYPPCG